MSRQQTSIKQSALGWIKRSIDDNLSDIKTDLKQYIESRAEALLEHIKERLTLVQGVLMMIEQYSAAILVEEMISLSDYIIESGSEKGDESTEVFLRAVLQLPDYLEHIQSGRRDIPIAILPLLNDIRAVKKQDMFSERLLFLPDLSMHQTDPDDDIAIDERSNQYSKQLAKKLRPVYQMALLNLIKGNAIEENVQKLEAVCETFEKKSTSEQAARIWWIIGALAESIVRQELNLGTAIKNLLGKVDALFRVILMIGERGLLQHQPTDLIKNLLYYIAQSENDGPKTQAVKAAYRLEQFLPSADTLSRARSDISGPNQALLKTVSEALKMEIETVKSVLEVYVNGDPDSTEQLKELPQALTVISDTLAMIGLGQQRQTIKEQILVIKTVIAGNRPSSDETLLWVASELIQLEQTLDLMQKRLVSTDSESNLSETDVSRSYELDGVLKAVVLAALDNIQKAKNAILEFIKESDRSTNIHFCMELMKESKGALELLDHPRAVAMIDGLLQYLQACHVSDFIQNEYLDALSQVIVSLEYYLEALGEHRDDVDDILDGADSHLQVLLKVVAQREAQQAMNESHGMQTGDFVAEGHTEDFAIDRVRSNDVPASTLGTDSGIEVLLAGGGQDLAEVAAGSQHLLPDSGMQGGVDVAQQKPLAVEPVEEVLPVLMPGSDAEILGIYLEEAAEEAENITHLQRDWLLDPDDQSALINIRRALHTIKGSGRLVGALKIAEFSWDYEQLLNRLIDKTIVDRDAVIDAIGQAAVALSELVAELNTRQPPASNIPYLRGLARLLARFDVDEARIERTQAVVEEESPDDYITGVIEELEVDAERPESASHPVLQDAGSRLKIDDDVNPDATTLDAEAGASGPALEMSSEKTQGADASSLFLEPAVAMQGHGFTHEELDATIDPALLTIYQQEVEQHLSTVHTALEVAEESGYLVPDEDTYRALHTIHGASRTAAISSIGELASLMEKPLKAALLQSRTLDQAALDLYRSGYHALYDMTSSLVKTRQLPQIPAALKVSFRALEKAFDDSDSEQQESIQRSDSGFGILNTAQATDAELLPIFIDEAKELLEICDHTLHIWIAEGADPDDAHNDSAVMELQRHLHTLKGGAKMAELTQISNLSHELESMFIAIIDQRVEKSKALIDLLGQCFDQLHTQLDKAQEKRPPTDPGTLIKQLEQFREHSGLALSETRAETHRGIAEAEGSDGSSHPAMDSEQTRSIIRVRSGLLDSLLNAAGEISIYRARMEQQVTGLGAYVGELGQTITRLKNQLRSLEAETDAQIHFSHQSDAQADGNFDPLEMDRYTLIQELSRALSESVNDLSSLREMLDEQVKSSETLLLQQSRVNTDLQDGLVKSRMVRFSSLLPRLRRLVRQNSEALEKQAELVSTGEENEVDNKVLNRMIAPLEHIIRNALSHGIEMPVERIKKSKAEIGTITLDIKRDGADFVITVSDDGAGVNLDRVRERALQLNLVDPEQDLSASDLVQYILEPGFSTADQVTQVSGRGIGMDVVDMEIKRLGGTLEIETGHQGTCFTARLPLTLSINQALLVRAEHETYAIPLPSIEGVTRFETTRLATLFAEDNPVIDHSDQSFSLYYLSFLVGISSPIRVESKQPKQPVIFIRSGDQRIALHVDEILGNHEIVVKPLGKQISQVKGLAGASILADGSVVFILDVGGLVRQNAGVRVKIVYQPESTAVEDAEVLASRTVMVVDDSITMRRVAGRLLERHGYHVVTAKDGVEALLQLEDLQPEVMLIDIEMPRMDGFELASQLKKDARFAKIPIIMITSRTGEKHRERAVEVGVVSYMGKPYQEDELIDNIQNALET